MSCRFFKIGARIKRHNLIVNVFTKYIELAGGVPHTHPKSIENKYGRVLDVDANIGGKRILNDVIVTHPKRRTTCKRHLILLGRRTSQKNIRSENMDIRLILH